MDDEEHKGEKNSLLYGVDRDAETANWKRRNAVDEIVEIDHVGWVAMDRLRKTLYLVAKVKGGGDPPFKLSFGPPLSTTWTTLGPFVETTTLTCTALFTLLHVSTTFTYRYIHPLHIP